MRINMRFVKNNSIHMELVPTKKIHPTVLSLFAVIFFAAFLFSVLFWSYAKYFPADPINIRAGLVLGWSGWVSAILLIWKINKKE